MMLLLRAESPRCHLMPHPQCFFLKAFQKGEVPGWIWFPLRTIGTLIFAEVVEKPDPTKNLETLPEIRSS